VRRQSGTAALLPTEVVPRTTSSRSVPADQIVVDGEVLEENNLAVDESLLTGEADPIVKDAGGQRDVGQLRRRRERAYRATKVGREAYAAKLSEEASKFTLVNSELRSGINKILQFITYLLVPAGLLIIYTQLFTTDAGWRESVLRMVGALVPMVPEGLVLMTSIAFARRGGAARRRQCLVNELPAIEGLARVDVVCADKTGTLTETVCGYRISRSSTNGPSPTSWPSSPPTTTGRTPASKPSRRPTRCRPLDRHRNPRRSKSATKWSGASYGEHGNWVIGAPDVLLEPASAVR